MSVRVNGSQYLERTANLPPFTGMTIGAWFRRRAASLASFEAYIGIGSNAQSDEVSFGNDTGSWGIVSYDNAAARAFTAFASTPANDSWFYGAVSLAGNGTNTVQAYQRLITSNVFQTAAVNLTSFTLAAVRLGTSVFDGTDFSNCDMHNAKCWDRVLTPAELLIESYFLRPMFPASLNFWWPLFKHTELQDFSGNARAASSSGTLATGDDGVNLWRPGRRQRIYVVSAGRTLSMNVTDAADTAAVAAKVKIHGSFNKTEAADVAAIAAKVKVHGSFNRTDPTDVAAVAADVVVHASFNRTDPTDSAAIAADVIVHTSLAATEAKDTLAAALDVIVHASMNRTDPTDVAAVDASVVIVADLAALEAKDTAAVDASVVVQLDMGATEARDICLILMEGATLPEIEADLAATDQTDTLAFAADVKVKAALAVTEARDVLAGALDVVVSLDLGVTDPPDLAAITVTIPPIVQLALTATEALDLAAIDVDTIRFLTAAQAIAGIKARQVRRSAILDRHGAFAKKTVEIDHVNVELDDLSLGTITRAQYNALTQADREEIWYAGRLGQELGA